MTGIQGLHRFEALMKVALDGGFSHYAAEAPAPHAIRLTPRAKTLRAERRLLVLGAIHGDEIGGLSAIVTWLERAQTEKPESLAPNCKLTFAVGNPQAVIAGRRFTERDLNRSFGRTLVTRETYEDQRALEIEALIHKSDFVLDLHQTIQPAQTPFFVIRASRGSLGLLASWSLDLPILAYEGDFSDDGATAGSYSTTTGRPSITLESGQLGVHEEQRAVLFDVFDRVVQSGTSAADWRGDHWKSDDLLRALKSKRLFTWGQTVLREGDLALVPGLQNFSQVTQGQILASGTEREVRALATAPVLFPKYGEIAKRSAELLRCLKPLSTMELAVWLE